MEMFSKGKEILYDKNLLLLIFWVNKNDIFSLYILL